MRITCNRKSLLTAARAVSSAVPARSPKPILQNLKLVVEPDGSATILATDLDVGIRRQVGGVKAEKPGEVILPCEKICSILSTGIDEELAIETDGDHLIVRGLRSQFKLPSEDPTLFPPIADFTSPSYHVVAAADLKRLIRRTMFATDVESTRYALGGVLVELTAATIAMVATDGRRLAKQFASVETENEPGTPGGSPVIPVKALKLIDKCIDDDDPPVHFAIQAASAVLIRTHDSVIYSRLVEGRFPQYQNVFPAEPKVWIPLEVGSLRQAVEQAAIATSDESRGVDFTFGRGLLTLSGQAADVGGSHIETPISYQGDVVEITFDPRYLLDALKTLADHTFITAELIDSKEAAVFRTDDDYSYVVMPLTKDRPTNA